MKKKGSITRQHFLRKFVQASGIRFEDAAKCYDAMEELFADAIMTGQKISVGRVLSIHPVRRKARKVNMGFKGIRKTLFLSDRLAFKLKIFREFMAKRNLQWQL
jgi:hypothetical protein